MSYVMAVSKAGYNVLTEKTPDNFVFHSDYDTLKYATQGTYTLTVDYADFYDYNPGIFPIIPPLWSHYKSGTVAHNLGYVPYFAGYLHLNSTTACQTPYAFGDAGYFAFISVYADATYLYFTANFNSPDGATGTLDIDFSYKVFKNDLGL